MKKVIIFGGSGFIGKHLVEELNNDYKIIVISRRKRSVAKQFKAKIAVERLRTRDLTKLSELLEDAKAVINLAGENVGGCWSKKKLDKIRKSRLDIDNIIVRAIRNTKKKPEVLIQGSAIGIYGLSRDNIDVTEKTALGQRGFLSKLTISHENTFKQLEKLMRVVYIRTGMVLDAKEGVLPKIATPFRWFIGGQIGSGNQWNSWIHIDDEVRAIRFLIEHKGCHGAYNLTAPNPVKQKQLAIEVGHTLKRPSYLPKPAFLLRFVFGKMANELLLNGLKILPEHLIEDGFKFNFEDINSALSDIYGNSK